MTIFHSIFHMLPQPMAVVTWEVESPRFEYANEAFVRLTGLTEDELRQTSPCRLFTSWNDGEKLCPEVKGTGSCVLQRLSSNQTIRLRLTWKPILHDETHAQLLTAEDISAKTWIDAMTKSKTILFSGIVDANFIIHRFEQKFPGAMLDIPVEHESAFTFFHDRERTAIERMMKRVVSRRQPESFVVKTKKIADTLQLEVESTICPFFDGFGSLKQYAFIVTNIRHIAEATDPSVMLKVLMAKRGISAQQLSEATGISMQTISKLRNGKIKKPQRLTAELIAAELNVPPSDIWCPNGSSSGECRE